MPSLYPWQYKAWLPLMQNATHQHHALLIHGSSGIGTLNFAKTLQAALLCEKPLASSHHACGQCASCHWLSQHNHPDALHIYPDELLENDSDSFNNEKNQSDQQQNVSEKKNSKEIRIEQIRELIQISGTTSHRSTGRVVLIYPTEKLNTASANALLKIIEEPPLSTRFILVTHQIHTLLPTLLSRCQKVASPRPSREEAKYWLRQQGISKPDLYLAQTGWEPLAALNVVKKQSNPKYDSPLTLCLDQLKLGKLISVSKTATLLSKFDWSTVLMIMQRWGIDLLSAYTQAPIINFISEEHSICSLVKRMNYLLLDDWLKLLNYLSRYSSHPLSTRLQIEKSLIAYQKIWL